MHEHCLGYIFIGASLDHWLWSIGSGPSALLPRCHAVQILLLRIAQALISSSSYSGAASAPAPPPSHAAPPSSSPWTIDVLQRYLLWVKRAFQPAMTPEANVRDVLPLHF